MITLYGFAISNYYNKIKFALLEKEIPFTEQFIAPSQDEKILKHSPLGKIPFIQTASGYLSESQAILEYLEEAYPEHPLYPADTFERAKVREFILHIELNVELIARRIYAEAFFGTKISEEVKDEIKNKVIAGLTGLTKLLKLNPYMLGNSFGAADIVAWPHLRLIGLATQKIYGQDLVGEHISGMDAYFKLIENRPYAQKISSDRESALARLLQSRQG